MTTHALDVAIAADRGTAALDADNQLLLEELRARGLRAAPFVWDDPAFDLASTRIALIRSTFDYTARRDEFLAWADHAATRTTLLNPPTILRWNAHKAYLLELERRGVAIIPTEFLPRGAPASFARVLAQRDWNEVVLKPAVSAGGRDTFRVRRDEGERGQQLLDELVARGDVMVQPFLPGILSAGELSLVYFDGQFSHAARRRAPPGDFRALHRRGGPVAAETPPTGALLFAHHVLEVAPEPTLYARVDVLVDEAGNYRLGELELIEPILFFGHSPAGLANAAQAIQARLERMRDPS
jgi:glutathione synthase/RimK-type ligase-like ATP-grasp enzyme